MCDTGDATRCRTRVAGEVERAIKGGVTVDAAATELGNCGLGVGCTWMPVCPVSVDGSLLEGIPLDGANFIEADDLERLNSTPAFAGGDATAWQSPLADVTGQTVSCVGALA